MVVTSAIFWLFFAICILIFSNVHYTVSLKMTYGLVYRQSKPTGAGTSTAQSSIQTSTVLPNTLPANETRISEKREVPSNDTGSSSLINTQQFINKTPTSLKYSKQDVPSWMMKTGVQPHQYQVYENDSEIEESNHRFKTVGGHDKFLGERRKNNKKGSSGDHFKEKKTKKIGEKEYKEEHEDKNHNHKGGYKSYSKKNGKRNKYEHKNEKGDNKLNKKYKNNYAKKGFKEKYKMDKEDKIHKFWHDHQENGEFYVYGNKKKSRKRDKKDKKKDKWKKSNNKSNKIKKADEKKRKEGHKEDSGYDEKKGIKLFYHNEEEYGTKKKSKSKKNNYN